MKKRFHLLFLLFVMIPYFSICVELYQSNGKIIKGQIISETDEKITILSEKYGRLTYYKTELSNIVREPSDSGQPTQPGTQESSDTLSQQQPQTNPAQSQSGGILQSVSNVFNPFLGQSSQPPPKAIPEQSTQPKPQNEPALLTTGQDIPPGFDAAITDFQGKVLVKKLYQFEPALNNMLIKAGMEVKIDGKGLAKIKLKKDRMAIILDNTHISLVSITNEGDIVSLKINSGSGWFDFQGKKTLISCTLWVPGLILNSRDNFLLKISIQENQQVQIDIHSGDIHITSSKQTNRQMVAHKRQYFIISPDENFPSPQLLDPLKIKEWEYLSTFKPIQSTQSSQDIAPPDVVAQTQSQQVIPSTSQQPQQAGQLSVTDSFSQSQQAPTQQGQPQASSSAPNPFAFMGKPPSQQLAPQQPVSQPNAPQNFPLTQTAPQQGQQPPPPSVSNPFSIQGKPTSPQPAATPPQPSVQPE